MGNESVGSVLPADKTARLEKISCPSSRYQQRGERGDFGGERGENDNHLSTRQYLAFTYGGAESGRKAKSVEETGSDRPARTA